MIRSKKSGANDLEQARPALVLGERLIDREVHLAAFDDLAGFDLVAGVAEGREDPVLGLIDEDVAVGKIEDARAAILARAVPAGRPQLPANLEGDDRLAGAGRHGEQQAALALEDRLDRPVDRDLLVVALALPDRMIERA